MEKQNCHSPTPTPKEEEQSCGRHKIALKLLQQAGWVSQHQEMVKKGYNKAFQNFNFLKMSRGDTEVAVKLLEQKQKLRAEFDNIEDIEKEIERRGLSEKIKQMNDRGFPNKKRCLIFLSKNEQDVDRAVGEMKSIREKLGGCGEADDELQQRISEKGLTVQVEKLEAMGYFPKRRCFKFLLANDGDLEKAAKDLEQQQGFYGHGGWFGHHMGGGGGHGHHQTEEFKQEIEKQIDALGYREKVKTMNQNGFPNQANCLQFLEKNSGDVDAAMKDLKQFREQFRGGCRKNAGALMLSQTLGLQDKLKLLVERGHKNQKKCLQFLVAFDGDVEKVEKAFQTLADFRQVTPEETEAPSQKSQSRSPCDRHNFLEKIIIQRGWGDGLAKFQKTGQRSHKRYPQLLLTLLLVLGGDMKNAELHFLKVKEQLQMTRQEKTPFPVKQITQELTEKYKKELEIIQKAGYSQTKKNLKFLVKFDGNCDLVIEQLKQKREKKLKIQSNIGEMTDKFCIGLQALKEQGFDKLKQNIRALLKNEGNLDKAIEWLKKKQSKKLLKQAQKANTQEESSESEKHKNQKEQHCKERDIVNYQKGWRNEGYLRVFVDGNNILFIEERLRKLYLEQKINLIETKLFEMVQLLAFNKNQQIVLIFDNTQLSDSYVIDEKASAHLTSARPYFPSSDDAILEWVNQQTYRKEDLLIVTADRELQSRLKVLGNVQFMNGKLFLQEIENSLGQEIYNSILIN